MPLSATRVWHAYRGEDWVLRDVSVTIEPGEVAAVTGPSGSGKTTLLSILGGLVRPTRGEVSAGGAGAADNLFSWVFQTVNVLHRRSAMDNVALGLLARGISHRRARAPAAAALASVGLGGKEHREARSLSGGELQRLCVARALVAEPRFLLADEPTGQLDRTTSRGVIDALLACRSSATGIVIATHDPDIVVRCDRRLDIVDGALIAS